MSLDTWALVSNAAFFIFSALVLIAAIVVFLVARASEKAKDRELTSYKADAAVKVQDARTRAAEANKLAAEAGRDAAHANERAAALEKEAADLKLRAAELAKAVAPRTLEQRLTARILSAYKNVSYFVISTSGIEERRTAGQIRYMLSKAGWTLLSRPPDAQFYPFDGIVIHGPTAGVDGRETSDPIDALVDVLNNNGIVSRRGYPITAPNRTVVILVGPKPLPEGLQLKPEDIPSDESGNKEYGNILEP